MGETYDEETGEWFQPYKHGILARKVKKMKKGEFIVFNPSHEFRKEGIRQWVHYISRTNGFKLNLKTISHDKATLRRS